MALPALHGAPYIFYKHGYRLVAPYHFEFQAYCKQRWIGKTLKEMWELSFGKYSKLSLDEKLEKGWIRINGEICSSEHRLVHSDHLVHRVHAHEFPVISKEIPIIHETDEIIAVNKPPSIPVHPCGNYNYNSLKAILAMDYQKTSLFPFHRLDRQTSGVLLLARSSSAAARYANEMRLNKAHKEYVAKVRGKFPKEKIDCQKPIQIVKPKSYCNDLGKPSRTLFEFIAYDPKTHTSLVRCCPETGRTHQIRVHLHWLGYPIANDFIYGPEDYVESNLEKKKGEKKVHISDEKREYLDDQCLNCEEEYIYPAPEVLWLHSLKFKMGSLSLETKLPDWAS